VNRRSTRSATAMLTGLLVVAACSSTPAIDRSEEAPTTDAPSTTVPSQESDDSFEWTPLDPEDGGTEPLDPGAYGLHANGLPDMPWAVVDVPDGFLNFGGWTLLSVEGDDEFRGMGYWTISGVDRDPCGAEVDLIEVGTSVADLAEAFTAQQLTITTQPVPVTLDGFDGLYLELHVSEDIEFADCGQDGYEMWVSEPGSARYMQQPGQVDQLWILDVEGNTVVLNTTAVPSVTRFDREKLTAMIESVRFVPRE
jgi:hypothetical protein